MPETAVAKRPRVAMKSDTFMILVLSGAVTTGA
jgi:hypothetical protein